MFRRVLTLIWKELQAQLRDPDSRRLLIIPVILQVALFPFAATLEITNATIAIYNQDGGEHSIELMQRFSSTKTFNDIIYLHNTRELRDTIDNQHALLALTFPNNFSEKIDAGKTASLQVIFDGRRSNASQIVAAYIQSIIDTYQTDLAKSFPYPHPTSSILIRNWFNPNLDYKWFIIPSLMAIITTIGCLIVTAMSVAREREQGTFDQLLISPITTGYLMIGKIVPALLIATAQVSIILFAGIYFYGIAFQGSLFLLYFCLLFYGLALAGIGLLISSVSNTQQQAFLGVFGFLMPCILLSGYISPIENIPEPLQSLTWFNPVRHFIVICKGIYLKNFDFSMVWTDLWPLLIIASISLSLAYWAFKRF